MHTYFIPYKYGHVTYAYGAIAYTTVYNPYAYSIPICVSQISPTSYCLKRQWVVIVYPCEAI